MATFNTTSSYNRTYEKKVSVDCIGKMEKKSEKMDFMDVPFSIRDPCKKVVASKKQPKYATTLRLCTPRLLDVSVFGARHLQFSDDKELDPYVLEEDRLHTCFMMVLTWIMTLLSMSVMLLMLVGEMKFAMESVPGQRGSFSDVPLMGIYYMTLICIVSIATCTSSIFVHLEKFALRNPSWQSVPWYIRWLAAKKLFCCYVPKSFRYDKDAYSRNNNVQAISLHSTPDRNVAKNLIPKEINFTEVNQDAPLHEVLEGTSAEKIQKIDLIVSLLREIISLKERIGASGQLAPYWERIISRAEKVSLSFYLLLITINVLMFLYPELWY
uniref:Neur_chan_memb domain-containing protein n=1 Tax=Caenorhabditis tropicalis TaxID=1561998 RepID=A0A1I7UZ57_9PELO